MILTSRATESSPFTSLVLALLLGKNHKGHLERVASITSQALPLGGYPLNKFPGISLWFFTFQAALQCIC